MRRKRQSMFKLDERSIMHTGRARASILKIFNAKIIKRRGRRNDDSKARAERFKCSDGFTCGLLNIIRLIRCDVMCKMFFYFSFVLGAPLSLHFSPITINLKIFVRCWADCGVAGWLAGCVSAWFTEHAAQFFFFLLLSSESLCLPRDRKTKQTKIDFSFLAKGTIAAQANIIQTWFLFCIAFRPQFVREFHFLFSSQLHTCISRNVSSSTFSRCMCCRVVFGSGRSFYPPSSVRLSATLEKSGHTFLCPSP